MDCITRNLATHNDKTPMLRMAQVMDFVGSRHFSSKLDLTAECHNISIWRESVKDSTFCCHMGIYDYLIIQQGDCNAPATMMRAMNLLCRIMKDVKIHIDDILIANNPYENRMKSIRAVIRIAKDQQAWFNRNKYQFIPVRMQML